jgi:hypothetical protein
LLPFLCAASVQSRSASGPESGRALERLIDPHLTRANSELARFTPGSLRAESGGYLLHAATCIPAAEREALEHLCRYVARPPLAQGRLLLRDDGMVIWNLRKPWRDGTRGFVLDPLVFIERLVALIPLCSRTPAHLPRRPGSRLAPARRRRPAPNVPPCTPRPVGGSPVLGARTPPALLLGRAVAPRVRRRRPRVPTLQGPPPLRVGHHRPGRHPPHPRAPETPHGAPAPHRPPALRPSPTCRGDPAGGPAQH